MGNWLEAFNRAQENLKKNMQDIELQERIYRERVEIITEIHNMQTTEFRAGKGRN